MDSKARRRFKLPQSITVLREVLKHNIFGSKSPGSQTEWEKVANALNDKQFFPGRGMDARLVKDHTMSLLKRFRQGELHKNIKPDDTHKLVRLLDDIDAAEKFAMEYKATHNTEIAPTPPRATVNEEEEEEPIEDQNDDQDQEDEEDGAEYDANAESEEQTHEEQPPPAPKTYPSSYVKLATPVREKRKEKYKVVSDLQPQLSFNGLPSTFISVPVSELDNVWKKRKTQEEPDNATELIAYLREKDRVRHDLERTRLEEEIQLRREEMAMKERIRMEELRLERDKIELEKMKLRFKNGDATTSHDAES